MTALINKTMSRDDLASPQARRIVRELDELVRRLEAMGLPPSTWYGELETGSRHRSWERINRGPDYEPLTEAADDDRYPWFLYWEIAWLTLHNEYRAGQRLLDLGGAGSLFACYVASLGVEVTAIDLNEELVKQGSLIAERTGWPLSNLAIDMQEPHVSGPFDHATSVCVFEHLPLSGRVQVSRGVPELLVPGGSFSVTFDYLNPAPTAMISSPAAVHAQFARASGLGLRGNQRFHDTGERYLLHPGGPDSGRYTFGALFMEKR